MKRIVGFIFLSVLISSWGWAQFDCGWRGGSAWSLQGKTFVLCLFVSTIDHKWGPDEKFNIYKKQGKALNWLKRKAYRYGVKVSFDEMGLGWNEEIWVDTQVSFDDDGDYARWVADIFSKTEFKTIEKYNQWAAKTQGCDNCLFVIYLNCKGRSFAEPVRFSRGLFTEGCVVYTKKQNDEEQFVTTIAHEMLHLFGAWDLYRDYVKDQIQENLAAMYFPKDIMLHEDYAGRICQIEKLTAWLVGLTNEYDEWYLKFEPGRY